jgi:hypothetical protein
MSSVKTVSVGMLRADQRRVVRRVALHAARMVASGADGDRAGVVRSRRFRDRAMVEAANLRVPFSVLGREAGVSRQRATQIVQAAAARERSGGIIVSGSDGPPRERAEDVG